MNGITEAGQNSEGLPRTPSVNERLGLVAAELKKGHKPAPITVRELLSWFGAQRRGSIIAFLINEELTSVGLKTKPDFYVTYIDGRIEFELSENDADEHSEREPPELETTSLSGGPGEEGEGTHIRRVLSTDPTYRIGRLRWANVTPTSLAPNQSVMQAVTVMLTNDFSQLPVMVGEREVKGAVSWSSIGKSLALGEKCLEVRECMESPRIISSDTSLFDAITEIVKHQYVLVRDPSNKISGIVTTSDLSLEFQQLTEPFLLLAEIENHVRYLIQKGGFTTKQLQQYCEHESDQSAADGVFGLAFGDYIRLLESEESWGQLSLALDRAIFIKKLDEAREIRNNVMHFDPDGITDQELDALRKFAGFLQKLQPMLKSRV